MSNKTKGNKGGEEKAEKKVSEVTKKEKEEAEDSISILTHPFKTLYYFVLCASSYIK